VLICGCYSSFVEKLLDEKLLRLDLKKLNLENLRSANPNFFRSLGIQCIRPQYRGIIRLRNPTVKKKFG
jgi:hypothetical protein